MKKQTGKMLIQDMKLKIGEVFLVGKYKFRYDGIVKENGKIYDRISPVHA